MKIKIVLAGMAALALAVPAAKAQTAVVSAGGEAAGQSLTFSYSLGQVATTGAATGGHTLAEGVQQTWAVDVQLVDAVDALPGVSVYPNPTVAELTLRREATDAEAAVTLFSTNGARLLSRQWVGSTLGLDLSDLPSGTYMVRVAFGNNRVKNYKVIKK